MEILSLMIALAMLYISVVQTVVGIASLVFAMIVHIENKKRKK